MTKIEPAWLIAFDKQMLSLFAIDHIDAGVSSSDLIHYVDLSPLDAALAFGSDYDLDRVDAPWPAPGLDLLIRGRG